MQVNGMRLLGLTVSCALKNFDLCSEGFLDALQSASNFMPSPTEISILEVDNDERLIKQAVTIDLEVPKNCSNRIIYNYNIVRKNKFRMIVIVWRMKWISEFLSKLI